jgi:hypothetical protein
MQYDFSIKSNLFQFFAFKDGKIALNYIDILYLISLLHADHSFNLEGNP